MLGKKGIPIGIKFLNLAILRQQIGRKDEQFSLIQCHFQHQIIPDHLLDKLIHPSYKKQPNFFKQKAIL
jgi:hypothetical protein